MTLRDLTEERGSHELRHVPFWFAGAMEEEALELPEGAVKPWPIGQSCSQRYRAVHDSGTRDVRAIRFGVIHTTECLHASTAAAWFADRRSEGSAHVVVDALECYRTLAPSRIPWAAPGANQHGWHLEIAGFASWSSATWSSKPPTLLERAAYKLAYHGHVYGFPMKRLTVAMLKRGERGVCDHWTCTEAFGGDHHDVGKGFPWVKFLELARRYETELRRGVT